MSDTHKTKTLLGDIVVSREAIASLVANAIEPFDDRVWVVGKRGRMPGIASSMGFGDLYDNVDIDVTEEGLELKLYLIVRFGTSIQQVTSTIIDRLVEDVPKLLGAPPKSITVTVVGTLSKQLVRRNIEVVWTDAT